MIKRSWIDDIISGIVEEVGSNNVYDISSHLGISIIKDNQSQNPILRKCEGFYLRSYNDNEIIVIRDDLKNETQIIAHELGHALLHTDYDFMLNNQLSVNGKKEKEANYFATKLLYKDLDIEDGIETIEQLARLLNINEECVEYIIRREE